MVLVLKVGRTIPVPVFWGVLSGGLIELRVEAGGVLLLAETLASVTGIRRALLRKDGGCWFHRVVAGDDVSSLPRVFLFRSKFSDEFGKEWWEEGE